VRSEFDQFSADPLPLPCAVDPDAAEEESAELWVGEPVTPEQVV